MPGGRTSAAMPYRRGCPLGHPGAAETGSHRVGQPPPLARRLHHADAAPDTERQSWQHNTADRLHSARRAYRLARPKAPHTALQCCGTATAHASRETTDDRGRSPRPRACPAHRRQHSYRGRPRSPRQVSPLACRSHCRPCGDSRSVIGARQGRSTDAERAVPVRCARPGLDASVPSYLNPPHHDRFKPRPEVNHRPGCTPAGCPAIGSKTCPGVSTAP